MVASRERDPNVSMHVINWEMLQEGGTLRFNHYGDKVSNEEDWITMKREEQYEEEVKDDDEMVVFCQPCGVLMPE